MRQKTLDFRAIYDDWFDDVERWLRAFGAPEPELEDLAQEVFIVVRRKLDRFDGANPAGWLYAIARRTWSAHRRRAWYQKLFQRRSEIQLERLAEPAAGAEADLLAEERRRELAEILAQMSDKLRTTFHLYEIEELSGPEIATLMQLPVATVWSRIHLARKEFLRLITARGGVR